MNMNNQYCVGCAHESTCKYVYKLNELIRDYSHFLGFICKYHDSKLAVKEEEKPKPYKMKDIYEGMQVSKFGAE